MKNTVNKRQFEQMIAECVSEVLAESRQEKQKHTRKVMNEVQMQRYIQNIINEELENEGLWDFVKGTGKKIGNDITNAIPKDYNSVKNAVKNGMNTVNRTVQNGINKVQDYANNVKQNGMNASAAADTKKLVYNIDGLYQKYGRYLSNSQRSSLRSAKSALAKLSAAFGDGSMNA